MSQAVGFWCVLVPFVCMAFAGILVGLFVLRLPHSARLPVASGFATFAWSISIVFSVSGRQSWFLWPDDAWRQGIVVIGAVSILLAVIHSFDQNWSMVRWPLACISVSVVGYFVIPGGEDWEDTFHLHRDWMLLVTTSGFLNVWTLYGVSQRGGDGWVGFIALAGLAGPLIYSAGIYGALAEATFAAVVATLSASLLALIPQLRASFAVVFYPAAIATSSFVASARFYSYDHQSPVIVAVLLFAPTLIGLADLLVYKQKTWLRVTTAATVSTALVIVLAIILNPEAQ